MPDDFRVSDFMTMNDGRSMTISAKLSNTRWVYGDLSAITVNAIDELFTIETFKNLSTFTGPYTLESFRSRISQAIKNNATYIGFSKNNKPFVITRYFQEADSDKTALFNVIYPYTSSDNTFVVLNWNFKYKVTSDVGLDKIEHFFDSVELPGKPAFPN